MQGLLVRVGVDQTAGKWNAPGDKKSKNFFYVPIPEYEGYTIRPGQKRKYTEIKKSLANFGAPLPKQLDNQCMHLDPDFDELTYGDQGQRAKQILSLNPGDFISFYASVQLMNGSKDSKSLVYALIGHLEIEKVMMASDIKKPQWGCNAHTRRVPKKDKNEIVVFGKPGSSGRFNKFIPVGEWRDNSYRVKRPILKQWGDLSVNDGWIQRSVRLPKFQRPEKFLNWLDKQNVSLKASNWD